MPSTSGNNAQSQRLGVEREPVFERVRGLNNSNMSGMFQGARGEASALEHNEMTAV
ncbi:hypothetical protein D3C72_2297430 [compost metagenome]